MGNGRDLLRLEKRYFFPFRSRFKLFEIWSNLVMAFIIDICKEKQQEKKK
jgi:hypothetical protein